MSATAARWPRNLGPTSSIARPLRHPAARLALPLGVLTGLAAPPLSLGALRVGLHITDVVTPITLEYGLTSRIGLQAVIPYVKNSVHVTALANPDGPTGTLGLNPAWSLDGARQQNGRVVTDLQTAATTLSGELARCLGSTDPACAPINANRQGAADLVSLANQMASAVGAVYGTGSAIGAAYAPVARGALQSAVESRLADVSSRFRGSLAPHRRATGRHAPSSPPLRWPPSTSTAC